MDVEVLAGAEVVVAEGIMTKTPVILTVNSSENFLSEA